MTGARPIMSKAGLAMFFGSRISRLNLPASNGWKIEERRFALPH